MNILLDKDAIIPNRAHELDAGYDLYCREDVNVPANGSAIIDTGVHFDIPKGYVGFLKSKSGLNVKAGLTGTGVIDSGYNGSVIVKLYNNTDKDYLFNKGNKIIQIIFLPIYTPDFTIVDSFDDSERGSNGFGSTGK